MKTICKKVFISTFLMLLLLVACSNDNTEASNEVASSTAIASKQNSPSNDLPLKPIDIASVHTAGYELLSGDGEFGDPNFSEYYMYDMDNDGYDEIIILAGTCEADSLLLVYKYQNNSYLQIGSSNGDHCHLCGNAEDNSLTVHHGMQGIEYIDRLTIKNGKLIQEEIVSPREIKESYTEFDYCIPLSSFLITDYSPFEASFSNNPVPSFSDIPIDITLSIIGRSANEFIQDYVYQGGHYIPWENNFFNDSNPVYNLSLDGTEENYYLTNGYITITARNNEIIGYSEEGFQVSDIKNVYQLLQWLGGDYATLLDYNPEMIPAGRGDYYLKWTTNNAVFVVYTTWWDGLTDWKNSQAWNFCIFKT